jgi:hypothetical protein
MTPSTNLRKTRYSNSSIVLQLQHLTLNLARIHHFVLHSQAEDGIYTIRESQQFIEWTARCLVPDRAEEAEELVNLGRLLSQWKLDWTQLCHDSAQKAQVAQAVQRWSDKLVALAEQLQ